MYYIYIIKKGYYNLFFKRKLLSATGCPRLLHLLLLCLFLIPCIFYTFMFRFLRFE